MQQYRFGRDLVTSCSAPNGRPSVDPVVFFKLQLAMFFEGIRSERQLMVIAADRLSLRWYLGYDLHEKLPDYSSLTKIRNRYGVAIFRRFFDRIVEECQQVGLVWGKERSGTARLTLSDALRYAWSGSAERSVACRLGAAHGGAHSTGQFSTIVLFTIG